MQVPARRESLPMLGDQSNKHLAGAKVAGTADQLPGRHRSVVWLAEWRTQCALRHAISQ